MRIISEKYVALLGLMVEALSAAFLFLSSTPTASALVAPTIPLTQTYVTGSLCNIVNWLFYGLLILSVIMVLIAGYNYLTSAGDPEKVNKAGKLILYAAIGFFVGLLAKGFPLTVVRLTGLNANVSACP